MILEREIVLFHWSGLESIGHVWILDALERASLSLCQPLFTYFCFILYHIFVFIQRSRLEKNPSVLLSSLKQICSSRRFVKIFVARC